MSMPTTALQALIGAALVDREFCNELLNKSSTLLARFDLTGEELEAILTIEADSILEFVIGLRRRLVGKKNSMETELIECLAWGLLQAYDIEKPPVPVHEIMRRSFSPFERLTLVELNLGLYDAVYRSSLDGSRLIAVDSTKPYPVQRVSIARELYVAFCHSSRAAELDWPHRKQPHIHSDLFSRCLLMPAAWIRETRGEIISLENLAARFDVPIQTMAQRLSEVNHSHHRRGLGESLAEALFSLNDPWRNRFLDLVADRATDKAENSQLPTREQVAVWLSRNQALYQDVRYMLNAWQGPKKSYGLQQR